MVSCFYLRGLLWAVLQHRVKNLHVVWISGVGQLIKDHQLHHCGEIVSVGIQQLPGESQLKNHLAQFTGVRHRTDIREKCDKDLTHSM